MNNELKITATANIQQANANLNNLKKTLSGTGNEVTRVGNIFDKQGNLISKTISSVEKKGNKLIRTIQRIDGNGQLRGLSQSVTDVKNETEKASNSFANLREVIKSAFSATAIISLAKNISNFTTKAIDYSESLNLFNVVFKNIEKNGETTFSTVGKQATSFQEKLEKNFGANRTESMYFQGLYQSMAESQGIADKYANIMSENSTKLTYDLSSLFNQNQEDTAEALRAGIFAGQTKPLRSYGLDITEASLQKTLDGLKATNSELSNLEIRDMSQAEKQILRYLTVLDQASVAHGDFANTIESPANQLKVFTNQINMLGVALGNLLLAPLQKFLTFANTIVIVVKQVAQAIASLFGIKTKDYNTGIASAGAVTDDFGDSLATAGDNAGKTAKKLKELKRETLGFDQINNINEQKDNDTGSGSGSGGGSVGGINQALLDALKGYDNGLDKVRLKAQQIADQIMRWLGFTYDAEEGVWKLGSAYDNLIKSCKNLGKALDVLGKYSFDNLINFYNNFLKPVAKWTLGKGLPEFVDITANGIMKTNWANLNSKLNGFYKALAPFTIHIGEGLLWFYKEVLVPLESFTIGKTVPEFVDMLANALDILNNTIEVMSPTVDFLWNSFLKPIASWTGGAIVGTLQSFNAVLDLISKNKVASTITALSTAFVLAKNNGGLLNTVLGMLPKSLQILFADGNKVTEILGDSKPTGLTKILLKLKPAISNLFNPVSKLVSSIKNASTQSGKFTTKLDAMILKEVNGEKQTKNLKTAFENLSKKIKDNGGVINTLKTSFSNLVSKLKDVPKHISDLSTKLSNGLKTWSNTTSSIDKFKTSLLGIGGAVASLSGLSTAMSDIATNGANLGNVSASVASGLGSIASGAMIGTSILPGWGTAIGACAGAIGSLVVGIQSYSEASGGLNEFIEANKLELEALNERINQVNTSYQERVTSIQNSMEANLLEISNSQELANELFSLVDVNGKVKAGYEDRVNIILTQLNSAFGTEFELINGAIYNNGQLINSYGEVKSQIGKVIEQKKAEIVLNAYAEEYQAAIQRQIQAEDTYNKTLETTNEKLEKILKSNDSQREKEEKLKGIKQELKTAEENYQKAVDTTSTKKKKYNDAYTLYAKNDIDSLKKLTDETNTSSNKTTKKLEENNNKLMKKLQTEISTTEEKTNTYTETLKKLGNKKFTVQFGMDDSKFRSKYNSLIDDIQKSNKRAETKLICPEKIAYANGGFPEEGPFYMNRGEIAGKFSNGKSVVANNQQITDGIKYAVKEGMAEVMQAYGGTSNVQVDVRADKGFIVETAIDGINDIYDRTGESPVRVF